MQSYSGEVHVFVEASEDVPFGKSTSAHLCRVQPITVMEQPEQNEQWWTTKVWARRHLPGCP
jgi:hypothetical protein